MSFVAATKGRSKRTSFYDAVNSDTLEDALKLGVSSVAYTTLISHLVKELCVFFDVQESVNPVTGDNHAESSSYFLMELSGFLREYGCPHIELKDGALESWLGDRKGCMLLLEYLLGEYQAAQIYFTDKPVELSQRKPSNQMTEVSCSTNLKHMLISLSFPKPPATITPFQLFTKVEAKLKELITRYPNAIGSPLLKAQLTSKQWDKVLQFNSTLTIEYNLRRDMLRKRLDVTIQSFLWSDKVKLIQDEALKSYQPIRVLLKSNPLVTIADLLAARDTLLYIEKTNSNRKGAETHINKVIMGDVPDRGGRTGGMQAPPPEMPSFMKRQADSAPMGQRPQSGRGRGGRGGRVQGGSLGGGDRSKGSSGGGGGGGGGGYKGGGRH